MSVKIITSEDRNRTSGQYEEDGIREVYISLFDTRGRLALIRQNIAKIFACRVNCYFPVGEEMYDAGKIVCDIVKLEEEHQVRLHEIQSITTCAISEQEKQRIIKSCISFVKKVEFFDREKLLAILKGLPEEVAVRPTSPPLPLNPPGAIPLLSMKELWDRFTPRTLEKRYDCRTGYGQSFECARYTLNEHEQDKMILEEILKNHNRQFREVGKISNKTMNQEGYIEKLEVDNDTKIFVRADLHGDSISLCFLLQLLQEAQCLDDEFRCKPSFHAILLGDFIDRGFNDIETLALIIKWRMENPEQVHLISGNHEDVQIQVKFSQEEEWIRAHRDDLEACYATFPVAFFIASREGRMDRGGRREYRHFSHGCFSPSFDPIPFLRGSERFMPLEKKPSPSERLEKLAEAKAEEEEEEDETLDKPRVAAQMFLRAQALEKFFVREWQEDSTIRHTYLWADVRESLNLVEYNFVRMGGVQIDPKLLFAYRMIGDEKACVKGVDLGHAHCYQEFVENNGKVLATTLPVSPIEWRDSYKLIDLEIQGFLYYVAPRMRDWEKRPLYYQLTDPRFAWDPQKYSIYSRLG